MSEFKGTKGKWEFYKQDHWCEIQIKEPLKSICAININVDKHIANGKLIACAPEMFKEIQETIVDLKILRNQIIDANKTNNLFDGMDDLMDKWIERKEDLIKKATE